MNFVQTIRDPRKLQEYKDYLYATSERDYLMLMLGINTGYRISDILPITVLKVKGTRIDIVEKKTGRRRSVKIYAVLRKIIDRYIPGDG